ncbi:MAG: hypothetical protein GY764_09985 [Halieaceae bacterium]|nr:hypothetical protein [Halieaceae bacterium]
MTNYAFRRKRDAQNAASISRQRPPSTIGKPDNPGRGSAWLAIAPSGGIPKRETQPGTANCEIFSVVNGELVPVPSGTGTLTIAVYNLADSAIAEGDITPVWQVGGVFVSNGPAAMSCEEICEKCAPFATENGGCAPLPGNCCPLSMCEWTGAAISNAVQQNRGSQFAPSTYWDEEVDICSFSVEFANEQGENDPNKYAEKIEYLVDYGWVLKWLGSGDDDTLWLREYPSRSASPCSGSFQLTEGGQRDPALPGHAFDPVTFDVTGVDCEGCCQNDDCAYAKDHITGLLVDFGGGRTFTQSGESYLASGAPCEWTVPITDSDAVETTVTVTRQSAIIWTVGYTFGNWRNNNSPGCGGTVVCDPNFGTTGTATFDSNGAACETGTLFLAANPDLKSGKGCKCNDATGIMNKLPVHRLLTKLDLLTRLFHRDGGPSKADIRQRLEEFLSGQES